MLKWFHKNIVPFTFRVQTRDLLYENYKMILINNAKISDYYDMSFEEVMNDINVLRSLKNLPSIATDPLIARTILFSEFKDEFYAKRKKTAELDLEIATFIAANREELEGIRAVSLKHNYIFKEAIEVYRVKNVRKKGSDKLILLVSILLGIIFLAVFKSI